MPAVAVRPLAVVAGVLAVVLLARSGRYGYHRDELYFLAAGRHLAWGYPDQGPLVPALARLMDTLAPGSLPVFRLPATIAAATTTVLSGLLARELGGRATAQTLTAVVTGSGVVTLLTGHLLETSTMDLLVWTATTLLAVHVVRTGREHLWLLVGAVVGVGLLNKSLPAVLVLALLVGVC